MAFAAAAFAAAELLIALTLGRFFDWGRAEALLFFAWRPWLLIAAALLAARFTWPRRLLFYASALLLAGLCESLLLLRIGASDPWPEMLRGLEAAALILVPADLLIQAGRKWYGKTGMAGAAAAMAVLLIVTPLRGVYDSVALGPSEGAAARNKPHLLLMTSLPIVWGERGAFDPASRPAAAYRVLQQEYEVRPIDVLDEAGLGRGRLLLLAQPRWLAPAELATLDSWIRRGGRALILADPVLAWPSDLPPGDIRRPVPSSLLGPLLAHWDLDLLPPSRPGLETGWARPADGPPRRGKLLMDSPGTLYSHGRGCRPGPAWFAACTIGSGRVFLIADADLMRDDLWAAPGPDGAARHRRISDNPLIVADLLDRLAGLQRPRAMRPVAWAHSEVPRESVLAWALLPMILVICGGFLWIWLGRPKPQTYPQGYKE
jgi:hypothetical protein